MGKLTNFGDLIDCAVAGGADDAVVTYAHRLLDVVEAAKSFNNGGGCFCEAGGPTEGKWRNDHNPGCLKLRDALDAAETT